MNFSKALITAIAVFAILGAFIFANSLNVVSADNSTASGSQTWIAYNQSNVKMTQLTATIHVTIKNTKDHVEYFKISQVYSKTTPPINFTVDWTDPQADRMIDPVNPDLGGDYGWSIQPGETKNVAFKVSAYGLMGNEPSWVFNDAAVPNTYWPLIPDMGLYTSWFQPNEIETLNPDMQLKSWSGTFTFTATNFANYPVAGIIRGPIIPTDSKLTDSDPQVTFQDKDIALNTNVAAWNINLAPDESEFFTYTYEWPISANGGNGSNFGNGTSVFAHGNATNSTPTVPSQNTGVPYGLFILAAGMVAAGVGYAKFLR